MKKTTSFLAISLMLACAPAGELSRTLHPPHQRYLDRTAGPIQSAEDLNIEVKLKDGLPQVCQTLSTSPLCLSCAEEGIHLTRCYSYKGAWNPAEDCHYSRDYFKCLTKTPPFAVYVDYRNSEEKLFHENVRTWISAVHEIWDSKLSETEKSESQTITSILEATSLALVQKPKLDAGDEARIDQLLGAKDAKAQKIVRDYLGKVEGERLAGQLKLSRVLLLLEEAFESLYGESKIFTKFATMSLDGLETEVVE